MLLTNSVMRSKQPCLQVGECNVDHRRFGNQPDRQGSIIGGMVIDMNEGKLVTLDQLRQFLAGTTQVEFQAWGQDEARYRHIEEVLRRFRYGRLKKPDKGLVLRYLERTTGYSRQQLTRLVAQCLRTGKLVKGYRPPKVGFARRFTDAAFSNDT